MKKNAFDPYGIAASALGGLHMYEQAARGSGRTLSLIERVQSGDCIITPTEPQARNIRYRLEEAGKIGVVVRAISVTTDVLSVKGTQPHGRTFFEHTWITQFFEQAIMQAAKEVNLLQAAMSKTWPESPAHIDTIQDCAPPPVFTHRRIEP